MTDPNYRRRLAALSLAMLLPSLGTSIANVSLPTLASSFAIAQQEVQWVVISYLLAVTSLIVSAGRLSDMLGRRRLLLAGVAVFAVASAACALAPSLAVLIAARAVQGLGAAIMIALATASVGDLVPKEKLGSAMGLLGTVSAIGTALGPSLGGALLSWFGWPALFVILAGAAVPAFALSALVIPVDPPTNGVRRRFDLPGTFLLSMSLATYALATTLGGSAIGVPNATLGLAALLLLAAFCMVELRSSTPLVHLSLLRDRGLGVGLASLAIVSAIVMATLVVGPFYLSHVLMLSPLQTGLVMSLGPVIAALVGFPSGRLVDRAGSQAIALWGLVGVGTGSMLMTILPAALGTIGYVASLSVITTGYALFQTANNTAAMVDVVRERRGLVSALLNLARNLGLITGASLLGAVFALGKIGCEPLGLPIGGGSGLRLTFSVAFALAVLALVLTLVVGSRHDLAR